MLYPICKLCISKSADKNNSHIIPKFLCKTLFENTSPRHALLINRNGAERKIQDTFKENNILCTSCEKRIEKIETHFAKIIEEIHNYKQFSNRYTVCKLGGQEYLKCNDLHPTFFKLFIYSLVWRSSISNLYETASLNLSKDAEEKIRSFLDTNLKEDSQELLNSISDIEQVPCYHSCIIKPKERCLDSRGILSITSMTETAHILLLVDFAIFFYTDDNSIGNVLEHFSNKQNEKVIIALGETEPWQELTQKYITKMLKTG